MAVHKATLAKKNKQDEVEYIYPRTSADLVEYAENQSIEDKINELEERIGELNSEDFYDKSQIDDLLYTALTINKLTATPNVVEIGTNRSIKIEWEFNKLPTTLKINNDNVTPSVSGSLTFDNITSDQTFTIIATDSGSINHAPATVTKSVSVTFNGAIYYGAASAPSTINTAFITGLPNKSIQKTAVCTFTINVGSGQYAWFACPRGYNPTFSVNGFSGGFQLESSVNIENTYGTEIMYEVYRSQYDNLGTLTISVK